MEHARKALGASEFLRFAIHYMRVSCHSLVVMPRVCYVVSAMIEMKATIKNANGIHCRPSAVIAKEIMNYPGDIQVIAESGTCDPRSIMALISLGLQEGAQVRIRVSGPQEATVCRKLIGLFEKHYDFPPRDPNAPPSEVLANSPFVTGSAYVKSAGTQNHSP